MKGKPKVQMKTLSFGVWDCPAVKGPGLLCFETDADDELVTHDDACLPHDAVQSLNVSVAKRAGLGGGRRAIIDLYLEVKLTSFAGSGTLDAALSHQRRSPGISAGVGKNNSQYEVALIVGGNFTLRA